MSLTKQQKRELQESIERYSFPAVYFDFVKQEPCLNTNMQAVEKRIRNGLRSREISRVKDGLSNILYWGYARIGFRDHRVSEFRDTVTTHQLNLARDLFRQSDRPSVLDIKRLELPQFSGLSFVSKVRMFLNPSESATLDLQIMKIHKFNRGTVLAHVKQYTTGIPITRQNVGAYEDWCRRLRVISDQYFGGTLRASDVERGFFQMVQDGNPKLAGEILRRA